LGLSGDMFYRKEQTEADNLARRLFLCELWIISFVQNDADNRKEQTKAKNLVRRLFLLFISLFTLVMDK
jgi:hypothetical protein